MAEPDVLKIDTSRNDATPVTPEVPPIAAAFLVRFDVRKGYTVAWQRSSVDGLQVDGVVEYKSLPSGLHNVKEDLVYFVHDEYAGVSAFLNKPGAESERNARMLAVGVLVPLDNGRMGKSWRHVEGLKALAEKQTEDPDNYDALEQYWNHHKLVDDAEDRDSPIDSPIELRIEKGSQNGVNGNGYRSSRRISTATVFPPAGQSLTPHHPAISLPALLQQFGPLLFPLYRAALLRKRILFVGEAPVEQSCNFVYDLSVLSALPKALVNILPIDGIPDLRLRSLFSVGVQDIPHLAATKPSAESFSNLRQGWLACTTDDVLATKPELFDILVKLPPTASKDAKKRTYPQIIASTPELSRSYPKNSLRSTQRDARRYINLRAGLQPLHPTSPDTATDIAVEEEDDNKSTTSAASSTLSAIVEPTSWSLMAYTSLVWWASAGEKRSGPSDEEEVENEQDGALLRGDLDEEDGVTKEVAVVAYFHRLTNLILTTISDAISRVDQDEETYKDDEGEADRDEEHEESALVDSQGDTTASATNGEHEALLPGKRSEYQDEDVEITPEDMTMMGLDVWSASDRTFVEELVGLWWGRKAVVRGGRIECCGVRIL